MSQCSKGCFSVCSKIQVLFCIYYIYKGSVLVGVLLLSSASYELLWISYIRVYSFSLIHMQMPWIGSGRLGSGWPGSGRLGSGRLGSGRLGSVPKF